MARLTIDLPTELRHGGCDHEKQFGAARRSGEASSEPSFTEWVDCWATGR
jgi:hypothetical protein